MINTYVKFEMGQNPVSVINSQFYPILIFDFPLYYNSLVMPVKYLHFSSGLHLWIQLKGNFSIIVYDFMKNLKHARTSHCVKRFEFGGGGMEGSHVASHQSSIFYLV